MSHIERQIRQAQRRLWLNRWLHQWGWTLLIATAAWTIAWIVSRLIPALGLPMGWIAVGGLAASFVGSWVWLARTREQIDAAAAALDRAAGLKERVSTGLYVAASSDPFAQAVQADAERSVAGLTARKFIPIRWTRSLSASGVVLAMALLSLLLPVMNIFEEEKPDPRTQADRARITRVKQVVARPVDSLRKALEDNPHLDIPPELENLEESLARRDIKDPDVLRREGIKQLDRLKDALKKQRDSERFNRLNETKKRLAKIGQAADPKSEVGKLIDALASGDMQEAQKSLKRMQEQLAKRARQGKMDPAKMAQMQKQLEDLSKKLEQAAQDKRSQQELKNAGLSAEEAKRILQTLAKKNPKQLAELAKKLAERLKDKGMTKEQLQKMLEKMQQRQKACKQCKGLGEKMGRAAKKMGQGQTESAAQELGEAGQMLDEMEQLEQAMNELEAQMSELDDARDELDGEEDEDDGICKQCNGTGFRKDGAPCPNCNGTGQCGGPGRGGGNRDRADNVDVEFKNRKAKTKMNKRGRIIGQRFVKGDPLKGKSEIELLDAARAAELDATDALNRNRVPRRYRSGVKNYFDRLPGDFKGQPAEKSETEKPKSESGSSTGQ